MTEAVAELPYGFWLTILELTVAADCRNAPFSSVRKRGSSENSGTSHEIEETGFEGEEREGKESESSGKEGENMG